MRKLWFREIIWKKLKCVLVIQSCTTLWDHMTVACHFLCPWDSPSNNTGVGSHSLLQGIFLIQELKPYLLYCRWILYHLSQQGMHACMHAKLLWSCLTLCDPMDDSPGGSSVQTILQARKPWCRLHFHVQGSSQPRDWTYMCCITTVPPGKPGMEIETLKTNLDTCFFSNM